MKKRLMLLCVIALMFGMVSMAHAIPALQIYAEGSTYDPISETWVINSQNFKLWVLGDVGHYGSISEVSLVAAYLTSESGSISITPTTATGVTDPSTPSMPTFIKTESGTIPTTGDGSALASHGEYGSGIDWTQYAIGNFTLTDSSIGDYINSVPTTFPDLGQINAYDVSVTGYSSVHFDAFDHYTTENGKVKYVFAPFSHDGESNSVPEPGTLVLFGSGLLGLGLFGRKKFGK